MGEETYNLTHQYFAVPTDETISKETSPRIESIPEATEPLDEITVIQTATEPSEAILFPTVDFDSLREINPDVIAWIYIEGTGINYPIVQGEDNEHYLSVLIDGTRNSAGSIFMDYRNEADFSDQNTVIYGHNMRNGSMFAGISNYRTQEYYDAHPDILVMTPDGNYLYEIVAGYVAEKGSAAWQMSFSSDELALEWIQESVSKSYFESSVIPELGDIYMTLSTCSYEFNGARFVLVAVRR